MDGNNAASDANVMFARYTNSGTFSAYVTQWAHKGEYYQYVQLEDDGTNHIARVSKDGVIWRTIGASGRNAFIGGNKEVVGLIMSPTGAASNTTSGVFDWFRFEQGNGPLARYSVPLG